VDHPVHTKHRHSLWVKRMGTKLAHDNLGGFQQILEQKQAELIHMLRVRDEIAIQKSADQMDEIQYASERDLAIRNADRDSNELRYVRAALLRIRDGRFGMCIDCEWPISQRRLAALPWALRCIRCQDLSDQARHEHTELFNQNLGSFA
jgi:DnaK suppressor protein